MISSAKMHKAEGILRRLQPFRHCVETIIGNLLSSDAAVSSPLTAVRPAVNHAAIVVLGSDDGLCGAYNVNIFKSLLQTIADLRSQAGNNVRIDIIPVGKKMGAAVSKICVSDPNLTFAPAEGIDSKATATL